MTTKPANSTASVISKQVLLVSIKSGVSIHWTGLLDWNTGLDYWTAIFLVFTHVVVG